MDRITKRDLQIIRAQIAQSKRAEKRSEKLELLSKAKQRAMCLPYDIWHTWAEKIDKMQLELMQVSY